MHKFLLSIVLAAGAVLPASAQYNRYVLTTLIAGGTNNVMNLATNTYALTVDVSEFSQISVQFAGTLLSSNFCNPRLDFMSTCDSSVGWSSTNLISVNYLNGLSSNSISAGTIAYNTNLNVEGIQALKLIAVANTNYHGIWSNVTVSVGGKKIFVH